MSNSGSNRNMLQPLLGIAAALLLAGTLAAAGGSGGISLGSIPLIALCALLAFAIQWVAFIPAYLSQTEHYFDLTGSATYITVVLIALWLGGADGRSILLALLVTLWAARLGRFLFSRVKAAGADGRFDRIKTDFLQFLMTWTLQGLWVFVTLAPALAAMTALQQEPLGLFALLGSAIWLFGFAFEIVADQQKSQFRATPANKGRFISSGLWAWSQHPNYFGEITLWVGVTVIALPVLSGWQLLTLISPLFVFVLLTRISGIRMLDARARRQWGEDPDYQSYAARTPILFPRPPTRSKRAEAMQPPNGAQ